VIVGLSYFEISGGGIEPEQFARSSWDEVWDAGSMTDLTSASFLSFVQANRYAVVHFWAEWNGYDAKMKDLLEGRIPDDISKNIAFGRFDTGPAEHWEICRELRVLGVPFLAFYRDGKLVKTLSGLREEDVLIGHFRELLS